MPMSTVRQYRFCAELGFNLTSLLEAPQIGRPTFTVTEITTSIRHSFSLRRGTKW